MPVPKNEIEKRNRKTQKPKATEKISVDEFIFITIKPETNRFLSGFSVVDFIHFTKIFTKNIFQKVLKVVS